MLKVDQLQFAYRSKTILNSVNLVINPGEIVGFVGNIGSGKTTTLSILSGCRRPMGGTVMWNERNIWDRKSNFRSQMGYVPDIIPVYPNATVLENLQYIGRLHQTPHTVIPTIKELGLESIQHQLAGNTSRGWTQWVGIAQAWIHKPKLLILDEPMTGLDPSSRTRFEQWLNEIRNNGHSVFFSSHIMREVEALSDRILTLHNGLISEERTALCTLVCILERVSESLRLELLKIPMVDAVSIQKTTVSIECHPDTRSTIASKLANNGLLEMKRVR